MKRLSKTVLLTLITASFPGMVSAYPDTLQSTYTLSQAARSSYITPNSRYIFSISPSGTVLTAFDTLLVQEVETYSIGYTPNDMVVAADGLKAYLVTSKTDSVIVLDVEDPEDISQTEILSTSTSGVTFTRIARGTVSSKEYLYLMDASNSRIYIYNATDKALVSSAGNPINLTFAPCDVEFSSDGVNIGVLGTDGKFELFSASDFSVTSLLLDIGSYTATEEFTKLVIGSVPSYTNVAFALNSNSTGEIFAVNLSTNEVIDARPSGGGANDPIEIGADPADIAIVPVVNTKAGDSTGLYIYASLPSAGEVKVYDTKGIGTSSIATAVKTFSSTGEVGIGGMAFGSSADGYVYFTAQDTHAIKTVSKNPLVTIVSPSSNQTLSSGSFTLTFKSDTAGTYRVNNFTGTKQETMSSSVGTTIGSGSVTAGVEESVIISVNDLAVGDNYIAIFVANGSLVGRNGLKAAYDNVPSAPDNFKVDFGDQKIIVSFSRSTENDIDHYNVYFGTARDDLSGANGISSPIQVDQPDSGKVVYEIEPLTNGIEIFVQVSAVDSGGLESAKTVILSNIPEEVIGPIGLSGETGGCGSVGHSGSGSALLVFVPLLMGLFLVKRRIIYLIIVSGTFIFLSSLALAQGDASPPATKEADKVDDGAKGLDTSAPPAATAGAEEAKPIRLDDPLPEEGSKGAAKEENTTHVGIDNPIKEPEIKLKDRISTAFRFNFFQPSSQYLKPFFGVNGNEMYGLKWTMFLWVFEVGMNLDFLYEKAKMVGTTSGRPSGENVSLFMFPMTFPLYANLRIVQEQIFVPYGKIAYSLLYWKVSETSQTVTGWDNELFIGAGLKFDFEQVVGQGLSLRDVGVNHVFLAFEWGYTKDYSASPSGGLSFSGYSWGFGLGADY